MLQDTTLLRLTLSAMADTTVTGRQINSDTCLCLRHPQNRLTVMLFLAVLWRLSLTSYNEYSVLSRASSATRESLIVDLCSCSVRSSTGLTSEIMWCSSWRSWSINAWTAGHLSTLPFTVSHCPARDIFVPLSEVYCRYHVTDSTCTAAPGLLPLLVCLPGTVFWTLIAIWTPPKLLSGTC